MSEVTMLSWPQSGLDRSTVARAGAVTALLGSAVLHSTVITEHYAVWWAAGLFFLGIQMVETFLALAVVLRWSRATAVAVVVTSLGTVAVWLLSRTVGVPIGPESLRQPETVGAIDLACCILELTAAAVVLSKALGREPQRSSVPVLRVWTLPATVLLVVGAIAVTAVGLRSAVSDDGPSDSRHTGEVSHTHVG